jgi:hypothetical protein
MLFPLDDGRIAQEASSDSALDQQVMQLNQRRYCDARHSKRHTSAGDGIEHPCRHHDDYARRYLNVDNLAADALFDILAPNPVSIERVPPVTNFNFLPDMGRMTA